MVGMPYQCLRRCGSVLVTASASHLDTFNLTNGTKISRWSCPIPDGPVDLNQTPAPTSDQSETSSIDIVLHSEPPSKKRRLSSNTPVISELQTKMLKQRPNKMKTTLSGRSTTNIVCLAATQDGHHVIAVTGEDKTVRVLRHDGHGVLIQLSERSEIHATLSRNRTDRVKSHVKTSLCHCNDKRRLDYYPCRQVWRRLLYSTAFYSGLRVCSIRGYCCKVSTSSRSRNQAIYFFCQQSHYSYTA